MTIERIKLGTFVAFIIGCFGIGFYAGEAVASIAAVRAHAASGQAYVYMEVIENGKVVNRVSEVRPAENGSVSVVVKDSRVEVNGVEVSQGSDGADGADGRAGLNTVVFVTTDESGADGVDGKAGASGAAATVSVSNATSIATTTTTATTSGRTVTELTSVYSLINSLVAYVATLLSR